jgi:hypothetical protein
MSVTPNKQSDRQVSGVSIQVNYPNRIDEIIKTKWVDLLYLFSPF